MPPDPKPARRVRDVELLRRLHIEWRGDCVLAGNGLCDPTYYSLHHVHRHPRDDVEANLVMLCGHGTRGHHWQIEDHRRTACVALAHYLITERLDTMEYLGRKLGGVNAVREWLESQLHWTPAMTEQRVVRF